MVFENNLVQQPEKSAKKRVVKGAWMQNCQSRFDGFLRPLEVNEIEQFLLVEWLFKNFIDSKLDYPSQQNRCEPGGYQQNGDGRAIGTQTFSQLQTGHLWHVMIQNQARQMFRC
jgi:hypothetical protein